MPSALRCSSVFSTYSSFGPGLPDRARHDRRGLSLVEAAGILLVIAVDDVGDRADDLAAVEPDRQHALEIDAGDQLAVAQIGQHLVAQFARHAEGEADAGAAAVEPEHQPRPLARAAIDEGGDAERAAEAVQPGAACLDMREARPPHQRAIAKDPKIAHIDEPRLPRTRKMVSAWALMQVPEKMPLSGRSCDRDRDSAGA